MLINFNVIELKDSTAYINPNKCRNCRRCVDMCHVEAFVVYRSAFDYHSKGYRLNQISVVGMSERAEASPAKVVEIIKLVKDKNIKYLFTEPLTFLRKFEVSSKTCEGLDVFEKWL